MNRGDSNRFVCASRRCLGLIVALACVACGGGIQTASPDGGVGPLLKLTVEATGCAGSGSRAAVDVIIERMAALPGPIVVTVDSPPAFLSIAPVTIDESNRGTIIIDVASDAPPGTVHLTASAEGASASFDVIVGTAAGSRDVSFGTSGIVKLPLVSPRFIARQNDHLIVAVDDASGAKVMRLDANGATDPTFGGAGAAVLGRVMGALAVRSDGAILAATALENECDPLTILSKDGMTAVEVINKDVPCFGMGNFVVEGRDRSVFVGGYIDNCCGFVARVRADGTPDPTFGVAGQLDGYPLFINSAYSGAMLDDGRVVLGGYGAIQLVNPDGSTPIVPIGNQSINSYTAVATWKDVIYGAGVTGKPTTGGKSFLAAYTTTGATVATFGTNGIVDLPRARVLATRRDGSLVAATDGGIYEVSALGELTYLPVPAAAAMTLDACGRIVTARPEATGEGTVARYWP
ncbi:hypothetical protein BH09MYX1_BH09MYX1_03910 [soil metagenome]